jgi:hypothetical protein
MTRHVKLLQKLSWKGKLLSFREELLLPMITGTGVEFVMKQWLQLSLLITAEIAIQKALLCLISTLSQDKYFSVFSYKSVKN